jgi:hypothetical protein
MVFGKRKSGGEQEECDPGFVKPRQLTFGTFAELREVEESELFVVLSSGINFVVKIT